MPKDYRGQDLTGANFRGQTLNGADFRGATLDHADFSKAQLRGAKFSPLRKDQSIQITKANQANFQGADLRGANFRKAELRNANFKEIKAGLQKRWWVIQQIVGFALAAILSFTAVFFLAIVFFAIFSEQIDVKLKILGSSGFLVEMTRTIKFLLCQVFERLVLTRLQAIS